MLCSLGQFQDASSLCLVLFGRKLSIYSGI
jgi:hypothetical protein